MGFSRKFGPVKISPYMVHHHIGNWSSVYISPTIVLPIQQVGFNCDNFYTIVQILYTVMCEVTVNTCTCTDVFTVITTKDQLGI